VTNVFEGSDGDIAPTLDETADGTIQARRARVAAAVRGVDEFVRQVEAFTPLTDEFAPYRERDR
jgi:hypothetical protein